MRWLVPSAWTVLLSALVVILEWRGFAHSRAAGEWAMLTLPLSALAISFSIGTTAGRRRRVLAVFVSVGVAAAICYLNYAYLYWLRVVILAEIDAGLFQYFGSVYALGIQATVLLSAIVGFLAAHVQRRSGQSGETE